MFGQNFNIFNDYDNRAKLRQKQKAEMDALLENESTTLADIFSIEN